MLIVEPPLDRPNLIVPHVQCSGTLIHPQLFLTAGHCTDNLQQRIEGGMLTLDNMRVSFGSNAYDPSTWLEISGWFTHLGYDRNTYAAWGAVPSTDVGVLFLKEPVTDITPATPATEGLLDFLVATGAVHGGLDGTQFTVVGYGSEIGDPIGIPQIVRDGQRRVTTKAEFHHLQPEWLWISQNVNQDEGGAGFADSGGPAFWVDPDTGQEILVATSARGDARTVSTGIFHRSDISQTLDFIDSAIAMVEAEDQLVAASIALEPVNDALDAGHLQPLLQEAIVRWQAVGADVSGLNDVQIVVADFSGATLGMAADDTIFLDGNAAGWGWFVDPTPWEDSEFITPGDQSEQQGMDLLTVIAHELGHLLGYEHEDDGVMATTLAAGERHLPLHAAA